MSMHIEARIMKFMPLPPSAISHPPANVRMQVHSCTCREAANVTHMTGRKEDTHFKNLKGKVLEPSSVPGKAHANN